MLCPHCNQPLGVYATEDIVREHAEDYGYVKLPTIEWLTEFLKGEECCEEFDVEAAALALHSALQGGKHA